ncbi:MAG TPA: undecaprenyldiphospho-muramoylpentapeptide beta-N-acetylglucosaminyltransferase [Pyrinomonadaceae bacterium]|jgi:UDP-N-acetylglucosamine--N-acetylmuramyl-(pentapeptide) pyrophosphoryl-undecaprenol N-acetylglucosamine transferase|nr:undecaprenyldiphospho-muramoylpentapeptide beta-N-acetylglucosaminyltransferase [Pyrinomonadaceae bacterium]
MKVLIAAGGTGGHIYPGIAIAKEIMRRDETNEVLFVGTARGLETKIVPENGFQLSLINSAGLKNVGVVGKVKGFGLLPRSFLEARKVIRQFRPHVVVGAGGYVSGPVLMMAAIMGVPTLVMDSNALPGFTNRQLARFIDKAALTFDVALPFFGKKGVVTGNPVRPEFFDIAPREPGEKVELLIFGGSQGAKAINEAVVSALPLIDDVKDKLSITHQTGEAHFEAVRAGYEAAGWQADIRPYISNMVEAFDKADLIMSRAGATTCAEVAAAGKAAIMIPLPAAADDHQRKNAEALVVAGAAKMILQSDLSADAVSRELRQRIENPAEIAAMAAAARRLARPDAAEATVDMIEELKRTA